MTAPAASVAFKDGARALEAIVTLARGDVRLTAGVTDERVGALGGPFWRIAGAVSPRGAQQHHEQRNRNPHHITSSGIAPGWLLTNFDRILTNSGSKLTQVPLCEGRAPANDLVV